jgi:hypothetical protein
LSETAPNETLLIAPKNPESFWTFDRILPSLGKRCVFPNLALPTIAALTPAPYEVVLCDENVEPIDFDTDADVIGITGFVIHKRRMLEIAEAFRHRGKLVVAGGPFATLCPEELADHVDVKCSSARPSTSGPNSCATTTRAAGHRNTGRTTSGTCSTRPGHASTCSRSTAIAVWPSSSDAGAVLRQNLVRPAQEDPRSVDPATGASLSSPDGVRLARLRLSHLEAADPAR